VNVEYPYLYNPFTFDDYTKMKQLYFYKAWDMRLIFVFYV